MDDQVIVTTPAQLQSIIGEAFGGLGYHKLMTSVQQTSLRQQSKWHDAELNRVEYFAPLPV